TPRIPMSVPSGLRRTKRQAPPGRRSIWHTASVQPLGPYQCGRCSGSVKASKTSRRGASRGRGVTISRSDGVGSVVAPRLGVVAMILLLLLQVVEVLVQPCEALVPEATIVLGPLGHILERSRLEPSGAALRVAALADQAGALEHAEVLGDGGAAHRERLGELLDRGRALGEASEDRPARRIGEGGEGDAQGVSSHASLTFRLSNHNVRYTTPGRLSRGLASDLPRKRMLTDD